MDGIRKKFLDDVALYIKSPEAKSLVSRELNDHMDAEKNRLIEQGVSKEEAGKGSKTNGQPRRTWEGFQ